eukprot:s6723_g3.t2
MLQQIFQDHVEIRIAAQLSFQGKSSEPKSDSWDRCFRCISPCRAPMALPSEEEVQDFLEANDVDSRAAADLRECPVEVQRKVLARGDLHSARNPSAALLARIRDARSAASQPPASEGASPSASLEVEEFIRHNKVDESAADSLRGCSPSVQHAVLARGELKTARNPSSALLSRIRDAKNGVQGGPTGGRKAEAKEESNSKEAQAEQQLIQAKKC